MRNANPIPLVMFLVVVLLGGTISTFFTVGQMQALYGQGWLSVALGLFFSAAFIALGGYIGSTKDTLGTIFFLVLLFVSIIASYMWQSTNYSEQTASSDEYRRLQTQYDNAVKQAKTLRNTAANMPANYHTRKSQELEKAGQQDLLANSLSAQMANISASGTGNHAGKAFEEFAKILPFPISALAIRFWLQLIVSIMLDMVVGFLSSKLFKLAGINFSPGLTPSAKFETLPPELQDRLLSNAHEVVFSGKNVVDVEDYETNIRDEYLRRRNGKPGTGTVQRNNNSNIKQADNLGKTEFNQYGFNLSDSKIDTESYVNELWANARTNKGKTVLGGRRKIADKLGISNKEADSHHFRLKKAGLVKIKGNATYPNVSQSEMLKRVKNLVIAFVCLWLVPNVALADTGMSANSSYFLVFFGSAVVLGLLLAKFLSAINPQNHNQTRYRQPERPQIDDRDVVVNVGRKQGFGYWKVIAFAVIIGFLYFWFFDTSASPKTGKYANMTRFQAWSTHFSQGK